VCWTLLIEQRRSEKANGFWVSLCAALCCRLPLLGAPKGQEKGNVPGDLRDDADRVLTKYAGFDERQATESPDRPDRTGKLRGAGFFEKVLIRSVPGRLEFLRSTGVYILSNAAMPRLLKIGHTTTSLEMRSQIQAGGGNAG
jgi:hypothetical protein